MVIKITEILLFFEREKKIIFFNNFFQHKKLGEKKIETKSF